MTVSSPRMIEDTIHSQPRRLENRLNSRTDRLSGDHASDSRAKCVFPNHMEHVRAHKVQRYSGTICVALAVCPDDTVFTAQAQHAELRFCLLSFAGRCLYSCLHVPRNLCQYFVNARQLRSHLSFSRSAFFHRCPVKAVSSASQLWEHVTTYFGFTLFIVLTGPSISFGDGPAEAEAETSSSVNLPSTFFAAFAAHLLQLQYW